MKNFTDPTYLRTIYDSLRSGAMHKDNSSALPLGLVGLYEEALPHACNVNERKKFLEFFAVWALLKKEVSAAFVVHLLNGWTEQQVIDYSAKYSKWFNSPTTGKYALYHERLRSFILQKISHAHFTVCNVLIIKLAQEALYTRSGNEWEHYALEHLSTHLLIQAMEGKDTAIMKTLAYNNEHWNRQVEISKGFEWSKRMLNDMMLWASKYNEDEVIECALNKVDLFHLEQNDASRIVDLVANNDMDTALQSIEAFGGNDEEGLQRKFILYMLCLMELTLLDSQDKPFRKEAIEKLLKHLDNNIPVDHSILNWNDFFSSFLMFQMACVWAALDLDYLVVYKRTENWDHDWLSEKGPYSEEHFQVLLACANTISSGCDRSIVIKDISTELAKQGKLIEALSVLHQALVVARGISDEYWKSNALSTISTELVKQGKLDEAKSSLQEALAIATGISNDCNKGYAIRDISTELAYQGKLDEAASAMQEALTCARGLSDDWEKNNSLSCISIELAKQGKPDEAFAIASGIADVWDRSHAMNGVSNELANKGKLDEALAILKDLSNDYWKSITLVKISKELVKKGNLVESSSAMQEALACARSLSDGWFKIDALSEISTELARKGKLDYALDIAGSLSDDWEKSSILFAISKELANQGKLEESASVLQEILGIESGISSNTISSMKIRFFSEKSRLMMDISTALAKKDKLDEALAIATHIGNDFWKSNAMSVISSALAKKGKHNKAKLAIQESLNCAMSIFDFSEKSSALSTLCTELAKQGSLDDSSTLQEILASARAITSDIWQSRTLSAISTELFKQNKSEEANLILDEALAIARGISNDYWKSNALSVITSDLAKQDKLNEAFVIADGISDSCEKVKAISAISTQLDKQGKLDDSIVTMQKALSLARNLTDDRLKSDAMSSISIELSKQSNWALAEITSLEIVITSKRNGCWKNIANIYCEKTEWYKAIQLVNKFQNMESRKYFLRGLADSLNSFDCNQELILDVLSKYQNDIGSMKKLLKQLALHQLFISRDFKDEIEHFNRTFKMQWAIDLKNSVNAN